MHRRPPRSVAVFGTGRAGQHAIRMLQDDDMLELRALGTTDAAKDGIDAGELAGIGELGLAAVHGLKPRDVGGEVDVILHCGAAPRDELADFLGDAAGSGIDVVSVSGCFHPRTAFGDAACAELAASAAASGARLTGTGVNPGFLLDVLPWITSSLLRAPSSVHARRTTDMKHWGSTMRAAIGFGEGPATHAVTELLSLDESLALLAESLCVDIAETTIDVEEVLAGSAREVHGRRIERGEHCGFIQRATATAFDGRQLTLEWAAVLGLAEDDGVGDGTDVTVTDAAGNVVTANVAGTHDRDAYPATVARAAHVATLITNLPPGLYGANLQPAA
jgi:hypothetical protein